MNPVILRQLGLRTPEMRNSPPYKRFFNRTIARYSILTVAIPFATIFSACSSQKEPPPAMVRPEPAPNPLPRYLRGTVRYEADLEGYGNAIASGYGIVVGLDGTGSGDIPIPVRTALEHEAAKRVEDTRIDNPNDLKINELLNSKNTAVVIVEGLIPAGATVGTKFDLIVRSLPGTSTTSIESGVLWSTPLRIQPVGAGPRDALDPVGFGRGDIFINPFAEATRNADGTSRTSVNKLVGRVLNGGTMIDNMKLFLHLRTPSYSRCRAITDAVNARFPRQSGQALPTAVPVPGQADERVQITVPPTWYGISDQFVEVLMHTPIFQAGAEARADGLRRWVIENPVDAPSISWSFVAIGPKALEPMQQLYDYPEVGPRLAALKAGAKLGDPLTLPHLESLARGNDRQYRIEAIQLLAELPANPRSMTILRDMLNINDRDTQIAAFEGLRKIGDPIVQRYDLGPTAKFALYSVPSSNPIVYIHQQGEPIVVVFGHDVHIREPLLVSAWGSRFMIMNDNPDEPIRVFYEDPKTDEARTFEPSAEVPAFVRFLARSGSYLGEAPGLGMNYGQTVGVLYALFEQKALGGPLVLQQDRVLSAISRERLEQSSDERPETNLQFGDVNQSTTFLPANQPPQNQPADDRPESSPKDKQ